MFYRNYESKRDLAFLTTFIIFCILNFGAILNNFFGADFAFIIEDTLNFPSNEEWFFFQHWRFPQLKRLS